MAWGDKYKQENILIHQDGDHNKFWVSTIDEKTFKATIRWGRLGTKGQSQEKEFSAEYLAVSFVHGKMAEKTRKGYNQINKKKFDQLCIQSAIVGTSNKCRAFKWVELFENQRFSEINEARLADPACDPGVYVELETKKAYDGRNQFRILFTFDKVYVFKAVLDDSIRGIAPITKSDEIYELTQKVEEALGRSLSM
jgi:predicted DNA-binding WGR domain protein